MSQVDLASRVAAYWDEHIHDKAITTDPPGTRGFFQQLDEYRYDKLDYLLRVVDFDGYRGKSVLEVGCGVGIDLVRFARGGASVAGIDLSRTAIELASMNFEHSGSNGDLQVMDGECMRYANDTFDLVYAHGVLQYTADPGKMIDEIYRVLRPGGEAILMVYNKYSWLTLMRKLTNVPLEHEDAPVLRKLTPNDLRQLLGRFSDCRIVPERFPEVTRLHAGWKAQLYNSVFVRVFDLFPRRWVKPFGWHLMAFATK
jgi:SAM-dependent methyltransferase